MYTVSVICYWVTNQPQILGLKQKIYIYFVHKSLIWAELSKGDLSLTSPLAGVASLGTS